MSNFCKCGNDKDNPKTITETEYSKWGWFLLTVLGLSAKPKIVKYLCKDCGYVFIRTNDPEILSKFVGR